jgi:hypothetical protein
LYLQNQKNSNKQFKKEKSKISKLLFTHLGFFLIFGYYRVLKKSTIILEISQALKKMEQLFLLTLLMETSIVSMK